MNSDPTPILDERLIRAETVFTGRLIKVEVQTVDLGDGQEARREVVRHPGASAVLAERPDGRFVWVEQYRRAVGRRMIEVVAGLLEPGEEPAACARREVEEETGYRVAELVSLGRVFASPGFVTEAQHLFYAKLEGAPGAQKLDPDERVRRLFLTAGQIEAMIAAGEISDSKSLCCWLLDRMRRQTGGAGRP
jgi:ADP-ribose pyrophosphatase